MIWQDFLDGLNATLGLWTAIAAVGAAIAALAAVWANLTTRSVLQDAQAKERPWLNTSEAKALNRPGGFVVHLGIRNYGLASAQKHRMKAWRCEGTGNSVVYNGSSANIVVPTQELSWPFRCENYTPREAAYLVIRLDYQDDRASQYSTWLFYNWPIASSGKFAEAMTYADVEPAEQLRTDLANS
jgi:hypothetical protein